MVHSFPFSDTSSPWWEGDIARLQGTTLYGQGGTAGSCLLLFLFSQPSEEGRGKINFRFGFYVVCFFLFSVQRSVFPSFLRTVASNWGFPCMVFKCNCSCFRACWCAVQQWTVRFVQMCCDITKPSSALQWIVEQSRENQFRIAEARLLQQGHPKWRCPAAGPLHERQNLTSKAGWAVHPQ